MTSTIPNVKGTLLAALGALFADDTISIGDKTYPALKASNGVKLIPYCIWENREPGNGLQCWFKERE